MTDGSCPSCAREVTLIGGYCGHCTSMIASAVDDALESEDVVDAGVVDVSEHEDGYLHVRLDVDEGGDNVGE